MSGHLFPILNKVPSNVVCVCHTFAGGRCGLCLDMPMYSEISAKKVLVQETIEIIKDARCICVVAAKWMYKCRLGFLFGK